jgi:phosphoglycerate dehydrogenase-like enzyme
VLVRAHWLALACPLTDETRGSIDATALSLLPDGAHVINVARGEIVDEAALARSCVRDGIAGAYLDVFEIEPLPEDLAALVAAERDRDAARRGALGGQPGATG